MKKLTFVRIENVYTDLQIEKSAQKNSLFPPLLAQSEKIEYTWGIR